MVNPIVVKKTYSATNRAFEQHQFRPLLENAPLDDDVQATLTGSGDAGVGSTLRRRSPRSRAAWCSATGSDSKDRSTRSREKSRNVEKRWMSLFSWEINPGIASPDSTIKATSKNSQTQLLTITLSLACFCQRSNYFTCKTTGNTENFLGYLVHVVYTPPPLTATPLPAPIFVPN